MVKKGVKAYIVGVTDIYSKVVQMVGKKGIKTMGEFTYPTAVSLPTAMNLARTILKHYNGAIPTIGLAKEMGHKINEQKGVTGGAFYRRLEAIQKFGILTDEKRGMQQVTDQAVRALDEVNKEVAKKAMTEMIFQNIPLIERLFNEFGSNVPSDKEFSANLIKVTGVNWLEAQKNAKKVRKVYLEILPYLTTAEKPEQSQELVSKVDIGRGELKMPTGRDVWETILDANVLRWAPEKEAKLAFKRLADHACNLKLETTKTVIETLADFINEGNKEQYKKAADRILAALEIDLNIEKPKPQPELTSEPPVNQ